MPFVITNKEIVFAFSKQVGPILNEINKEQLSCIKFAEARSRLLPKLMSGKMEV